MKEAYAPLEIERTLLATMMLRPSDCGDLNLGSEQFASEDHGVILTVIRERLSDSLPIDPVSVSDAFEVVGDRRMSVLALQIANTPTTTAPDAFARRIAEAWRSRKARDIGASLAASNGTDVDSAIEALMALHQQETQHEFTAKQAAKSAFAEITAAHDAGGKLVGITTGLTDLDEMLGGLHNGDLIVVGARAAMGKTSWLIGAAHAAASSGNPIGIVSGEQPAAQVGLRLVSKISRVPAARFRTAKLDEDEWTRVSFGMGETAALPMWMLDRSSPSLVEVVRVARRWKHRHGIKALYIDYLQRIQGEGERKWEQVGNVARGLKNLARDLNIPVVVLAQVSRQVESGGKGRAPRLGDLSDSSEIEKEADQIFMLYREGYYDADAHQNVARVIVEKNRHGPTGHVDVAWLGKTMTFGNYAAAEAQA